MREWIQGCGGLAIVLMLLACGAGSDATGAGADGGSASDGGQARGGDGSSGPTVDGAVTADGAVPGSDSGLPVGGQCLPAPTSFELVLTGAFCSAGRFCEDGPWLAILDPGGHKLLQSSDCDASGHCIGPTPMPAVSHIDWDGSFLLSDCVAKACAAPGRYTARVCSWRDLNGGEAGAACRSEDMPTCKDFPFDWPTTATVHVALP